MQNLIILTKFSEIGSIDINDGLKMNSVQSNITLKRSSVLSKSRSSSLSSHPLSSRTSLNHEAIKKLSDKLTNIANSVDMTCIQKNPLSLIEYEMQGERSRHDPQMVLAKLRKLENRAQLHRANVEIDQMHQERQKQNLKAKILKQRHSSSRKSENQHERSFKIPYIKIYQAFLKQKQSETQKRYDDQEQYAQKQDDELYESKDGMKYFGILKKHPRLLDLTISRKKQQAGITGRLIQSLRKVYLTTSVKSKPPQQLFSEQKSLYIQQQSQRYIQNPQKVIERQMTKFYVKKNPGKLSSQAQQNERSQELIKKQKMIFSQIDQQKISKEDKQKMRNKFNELANELAKSDRRKSLQGILPRVRKDGNTNSQEETDKNIKKKLF